MKAFLSLALMAILVVAFAIAQRQCTGKPQRQECRSRPDVGRGGQNCRASQMWYYQNGRCLSMQYLGCGGNGNRYCSRADCERQCRRQG